VSAVDLVLDTPLDYPDAQLDLVFDQLAPDLVGVVDAGLVYRSFALEVDVGVRGYFIARAKSSWRDAARLDSPVSSSIWRQAAATPVQLTAPYRQASYAPYHTRKPWREAVPIGSHFTSFWSQGLYSTYATRFLWQDGIPYQFFGGGPWHDGSPTPFTKRFPWREAVKLRPHHVTTSFTRPSFVIPATRMGWQAGKRFRGFFRFPWRDAAKVYGYGGPLVVPPIPPSGDVCYESDTDIVLDLGYVDTADLLFVCDYESVGVIIPSKKVYFVKNNVTLKRVSDLSPLVHDSLRLSLDRDSWAWSFSATLPGSELTLLDPDTGAIELLATINGEDIRVVSNTISTARVFGSKGVSIGGRGRNAELGAPYAAAQTFSNPTPRTANQLMDDVLTVSGVPIGWSVNFDIDDWLVPANVFTHKGTYIEAITRIAVAAGAYVQPHNYLKEIRILPDYVLMPWDWSSVTPDVILPTGPVTVENVEWVDRPLYDRVYVSGDRDAGGSGILGEVTRTGYAGALVAPMFVDALITHQDAARQKGMSILGNTGRQALLTLRLPVFVSTGIITPGKFVQYNDGVKTYIGVVRKVDVEVKGQATEVWQTIVVETHV
jgi:hypothetical protein